jgi:HNH endonuclease
MKRAIFRRASIEVMVETMLTATPISPGTLKFAPGEEMLLALPKNQAAGVGEYQFLCRVSEYVGERPDLGEKLFRRPDWKHVYRLSAISSIEPFALAEVVESAGDRGPEVHYRYKGQTQHHRIIRTVLPEDEPLFRAFDQPGTEPAWSASAIVTDNEAAADERRAAALSPSKLIERLRRMSRENSEVPPGKEYRAGQSQRRNRTFASALKVLYEGHCQVCGLLIQNPEGTRYLAHMHHFEPWNGDNSDRLDNVICLCPNHHAMFELGSLRWHEGTLLAWSSGSWNPRVLKVDHHLTVELRAPTVSVTPG